MAASTSRLPRALAAATLLALPNAVARAQHEDYATLVLPLPARAGVSTGTAFSVERFHASTQGSIASSISLGAFGISIAGQYLTYSAPVACDFIPPCTSGFPPVPSEVLSNRAGPASGSSLAGSVALSTTYRGLRW